jgi:hypothetical protein
MRTTTPNLAIAPPVGNDRMMEDIDSPEKLEAWLKDKPPEWGAAIALRAALLVLPIALRPSTTVLGQANLTLKLAVFRAAAISWITSKYPTLAFAVVHAEDLAKQSIVAAADANAAEVRAYAAVGAVTFAITANTIGAAKFAVLRAGDALENPADMWRIITANCSYLESGSGAEAERLNACHTMSF